ncbi:hypothetical protein N8608_02325, partial [bacterium]|nr:hypothetical protein [bacterium]
LSSGATAEISKVLSHFDQVDIFWFGTIQNIPNSLSPFKVRIKDRESLFVLHDKYKQIIILDSVYLAARTNYENIIWIDFSKPVLFLFNRQYFNSHLIKQYENLNERAQLLSHLRQFTKFKYSCPVFTGDNAISSLYVVNRFDLNSDLAEFVLRADHFLKFASSVHLNIGASICLPLDASNFKFLRYYHDFNSLKNLHEYSSLHFNDSHNYKIENRSYSCQGLYLITDIDRLDIQSLKSLVLIPNKLILDTSDYEMRSGFAWSYVEFFCMSNKYRCVMYTESVQAFTKSLGPDLNSSLKESTIYATGPSLSKAYSDEFKPLGLSIICNTIVKDSELLESLKPKYCCAMDSDFHWGASLYCAEFRSDLKSCIQKYETYLFVPFVCLPLVRRLLEGCQSNIIGVHVVDRSINVDLNRSLSVKAVDNVLNVILLPLAASVSKRINLLGFDGRGRNDSKFWSHNQRTQYSELMESIEYCHPAFFICRDYSKYSVGQASNTEKFISHIESNSAKVVSLAPSNVSSINNRYES